MNKFYDKQKINIKLTAFRAASLSLVIFLKFRLKYYKITKIIA